MVNTLVSLRDVKEDRRDSIGLGPRVVSKEGSLQDGFFRARADTPA